MYIESGGQTNCNKQLLVNGPVLNMFNKTHCLRSSIGILCWFDIKNQTGAIQSDGGLTVTWSGKPNMSFLHSGPVKLCPYLST